MYGWNNNKLMNTKLITTNDTHYFVMNIRSIITKSTFHAFEHQKTQPTLRITLPQWIQRKNLIRAIRTNAYTTTILIKSSK